MPESLPALQSIGNLFSLYAPILAATVLTLAATFVIFSQCLHHAGLSLLSFKAFFRWKTTSSLLNFVNSVSYLSFRIDSVNTISTAVAIITTPPAIYKLWTIARDFIQSGKFDAQNIFTMDNILVPINLLLLLYSILNFLKPKFYDNVRIVTATNSEDDRFVDFRDDFAYPGRIVKVENRSLGQSDVAFLDEEFSEQLARDQNCVDTAFIGRKWPLHRYFHVLKGSSEKNILKNNTNVPLSDALLIHRNKCSKNGTAFTNEAKIRLSGLKRDGQRYKAEIEKTGYYTSQITNKLFMRSLVDSNGKKRLDFRDSLEDVVFHKDVASGAFSIADFEDCSILSNHIGATIIAISADGYPVFAIQASNANENAGTLVTSGSGSIDFADLYHCNGHFSDSNDLLAAIRYGIARELLEETGAVLQSSYRLKDRKLIRQYARNVRLAGYYRTLDWAGLPIFVGFARHFQTYGSILSNMERPACLLSHFEVSIWDYKASDIWKTKPLPPVYSADDLIRYYDEIIEPLVEAGHFGVKNISTQVLLLKALLKESPPMRAHFDKAVRTDVAL